VTKTKIFGFSPRWGGERGDSYWGRSVSHVSTVRISLLGGEGEETCSGERREKYGDIYRYRMEGIGRVKALYFNILVELAPDLATVPLYLSLLFLLCHTNPLRLWIG
jgi:hypothetical protein